MFKKNRRLQLAKALVLKHADPSTHSEKMSFIMKLPAVRYIAGGVAVYELMKEAVKSASESLNLQNFQS